VALDKIGNSNLDWNHHLDAVTTIRSLIVHHTEIVTGKQLIHLVVLLTFYRKAVVLALVECVDNLRSLVSKNAIQGIAFRNIRFSHSGFADMFFFIKKGMDSELEIVVSCPI
jgi:hypothetical protein